MDNQTYENIRQHLTNPGEMLPTYWEIGKELTEAIGERAEYGKQLLPYLSKQLSAEFGKGFTVANLRNMRQFHQSFPSKNALRSELTWTHYRTLMRIDEPARRDFYLEESANNAWTSRHLSRQIDSFYYENKEKDLGALPQPPETFEKVSSKLELKPHVRAVSRETVGVFKGIKWPLLIAFAILQRPWVKFLFFRKSKQIAYYKPEIRNYLNSKRNGTNLNKT